jgi:hypothetical protein
MPMIFLHALKWKKHAQKIRWMPTPRRPISIFFMPEKKFIEKVLSARNI